MPLKTNSFFILPDALVANYLCIEYFSIVQYRILLNSQIMGSVWSKMSFLQNKLFLEQQET